MKLGKVLARRCLAQAVLQRLSSSKDENDEVWSDLAVCLEVYKWHVL